MKYWERGFPKKFRDTRDKLAKEGIKFVNVETANEKLWMRAKKKVYQLSLMCLMM